MARVLYGLMGDSRGHLNRALILAREMPHHEFLFAGGQKALEVREHGYELEEIPLIETYYKDNSVDVAATIWNGMKTVMGRGAVIKRLQKIIREFDPELILSDWEYFTPLAALKSGRECISFDHQHIMSHCRYEPPAGQRLNRWSCVLSARRLFSNASRYLIVSFYRLAPINPVITEVLPPLIRREVLDHPRSDGDHVLVYQTSPTFGDLLPLLESLDDRFVIYGLGARQPRKNLIFRPPSGDRFLEDLASSRYCIVNGGHNVICESLFYGKPIFCFPIANQFEQMLNSHFVAESGFGEYCVDLESAQKFLNSFISRLSRFKVRIAEHDFFGNKAVCARLEELIHG